MISAKAPARFAQSGDENHLRCERHPIRRDLENLLTGHREMRHAARDEECRENPAHDSAGGGEGTPAFSCKTSCGPVGGLAQRAQSDRGRPDRSPSAISRRVEFAKLSDYASPIRPIGRKAYLGFCFAQSGLRSLDPAARPTKMRHRMIRRCGLHDFGGDMSDGKSAGYLPGDPRYGLQGEALKGYYRTKPAQWAIYCWDKPGMAETRRALLAQQKSYVKNFGERVIGYGHFISDDGRDPLGTSFFMQLDDRAAADNFIADEPLNKAGVYQRVEIHRWSNSFGKRAADYRRKGLQQFLCTGPKTGTPEFFFASTCTPTQILLRVLRRQLHLPRVRSALPTAPTTSAPRCCSELPDPMRRPGYVLEQ